MCDRSSIAKHCEEPPSAGGVPTLIVDTARRAFHPPIIYTERTAAIFRD